MVDDICSAEQCANQRALQQRIDHRDESDATSVIGSQSRIGYSAIPMSFGADGEGVEECAELNERPKSSQGELGVHSPPVHVRAGGVFWGVLLIEIAVG